MQQVNLRKSIKQIYFSHANNDRSDLYRSKSSKIVSIVKHVRCCLRSQTGRYATVHVTTTKTYVTIVTIQREMKLDCLKRPITVYKCLNRYAYWILKRPVRATFLYTNNNKKSELFRTFLELFKTFSEHFQNIFRTFSEYFQNIFRIVLEHFQNILGSNLYVLKDKKFNHLDQQST